MKHLLYIAALLLTVSCTKEILVEVPVQNPINTQLQSQITQLQNTISNLTSTNNNLESQISLLQSEANLLEIDLADATENAEDLMDRLLILEEHIEDFNIETERAQQESFFRLNYSQTTTEFVLRTGSFTAIRIVRQDAASLNDSQWWEEQEGVIDGKLIAYSTDGAWNAANPIEVWNFYDANGDLVLVRINKRDNGERVGGAFYVEAYDYLYQFEDAITEFTTIN